MIQTQTDSPFEHALRCVVLSQFDDIIENANFLFFEAIRQGFTREALWYRCNKAELFQVMVEEKEAIALHGKNSLASLDKEAIRRQAPPKLCPREVWKEMPYEYPEIKIPLTWNIRVWRMEMEMMAMVMVMAAMQAASDQNLLLGCASYRIIKRYIISVWHFVNLHHFYQKLHLCTMK